jgi:hypothetical protein
MYPRSVRARRSSAVRHRTRSAALPRPLPGAGASPRHRSDSFAVRAAGWCCHIRRPATARWERPSAPAFLLPVSGPPTSDQHLDGGSCRTAQRSSVCPSHRPEADSRGLTDQATNKTTRSIGQFPASTHHDGLRQRPLREHHSAKLASTTRLPTRIRSSTLFPSFGTPAEDSNLRHGCGNGGPPPLGCSVGAPRRRHGPTWCGMARHSPTSATCTNDTNRHPATRRGTRCSRLLTSGFGVRVPGGAPANRRSILR